MNKAELVEAVAEKAELSKRDAEAAVDAVLEVIEAAVVKGEEVKLSGFGIFSKKARAAREGTNPSNQKKIKIPASNTVAFKVSKAFKEKLN
ncbi:MAG: HU family DNA-binding protein [Bacilli bacterium]|jgi:DNA-binding protein HU-beta|nr:HU family DNA-binding protein [Bacilli bacterium]MBR3674701.1 HU family DNA-binding protein [Bacilli bacterium]MBR5750294.1 HU family DNA-binding protein [Bacilli bacterium]MBR6055886.1 HU family DNA-binding protein [Bacilli bacterium]MBR6226007.1 HU family DNA-binding protein [Bacilli bacterium]